MDDNKDIVLSIIMIKIYWKAIPISIENSSQTTLRAGGTMVRFGKQILTQGM